MDRSSLHSILTGITANVYFQPPESIKLNFPCIIYRRKNISIKYADDNNYSSIKQYSVMVIDKNPDSTIPGLVEKLANCSFERFYTKDNLNYDVYNLYY